MKKDEAIRNLVDGSSKTNSEWVTVKREHLLIALGALPETKDDDPSVAVPEPHAGK